MYGDLSITSRAPRQELAASASGAHAAAISPSLPDGAGARVSPEAGASPPAEAARLRALLTDPAMRVSTHHDEVSGRTVLEVQSRDTGELIEQIPSEALLRLYATMREPLVDECA
jgi:FlaG protein